MSNINKDVLDRERRTALQKMKDIGHSTKMKTIFLSLLSILSGVSVSRRINYMESRGYWLGGSSAS